MRITSLKNNGKYSNRNIITVAITIASSLMLMSTMMTFSDVKATGIETCPDNWTFLLDGLNPDYFDCRNDIENSNAVIDDPIPSFQEVQSKYKPQ
jgi:hypothetical protein